MDIGTVKTHVKLEDYWEFFRFQFPSLYYGALYLGPLSTVLFVSMMLLSTLVPNNPMSLDMLFGILKQTAFMPLFVPLLFRLFLVRSLKKTYEQEKRFIDNVIYEFSTQGLTARNANSVTRTSWDEVIRFGDSKNLFFIYITVSRAYFIPKRDLDPGILKFLQDTLDRG